MSKRSFTIAAFGAVAILAAGLLVLRRGSPADGGDAEAKLRDLEARHGRLTDELRGRAASFERRLARQDSKAAAARSSVEPAEEPESEAADGDEAGGSIARIEERLEAIETRLGALEQDPVERGHAYVASKSKDLRRLGIRALRRVARSDPVALAALRRMVDDPDAGVRAEALEALADAGDAASVPQMLGLLADPAAGVRVEAVQALAQLLDDVDPSDPRLVEAARSIAGGLADPDPRVRRSAADKLGEMKTREIVPALVGALQDADQGVREEAILSLADLGDPSAVRALRALYDQGGGGQSLDLAVALKRLGHAQPFQREAARLSAVAATGESERDRRDAVRFLARHGGKEYGEVVSRALNDPSPEVRKAAQKAVKDGSR